MNCARCGAALPAPPWGRRDTCPACGEDLRTCVHCSLYAPGLYNDCREPQAERVTDKHKANFCDYFHPGGEAGQAPADPRKAAQAQLDALFKKGR